MNAPPQSTISAPRMSSERPRPRATSTPTARRPSKTSRVANAPVRTSRFGRFMTGMEIGSRGAQPPAAVDVPIERRKALLAVAVDVVGELVAGLLDGPEEGPEQRAGGRAALEDERAVVAAKRVVRARGETGLHPLEVRQAVGEVPAAHPGIGRPALVVERVAALEDHAVDAARATQQLAPGVIDPPAVHERLGLGLVFPVVEPAADRERERGRHVDEDVRPVVGPPGLEHEDATRRVGAQPVGQGAPGRAAADDHEVVGLARHGRDASSAARAPRHPGYDGAVNETIAAPRVAVPHQILDSGVIAIGRHLDPGSVVAIGQGLVGGGVGAFEVTYGSPGALEAIAALHARFGAEGRLAIGAGTVLSVEDAERAVAAGATFLVMPVTDPAVVSVGGGARHRGHPGGADPERGARRLAGRSGRDQAVPGLGRRPDLDPRAPRSVPRDPDRPDRWRSRSTRSAAHPGGGGGGRARDWLIGDGDPGGIAERGRRVVAVIRSAHEGGRLG